MPITKATHKDFEWVKKAYEDYRENSNMKSHTSKCPGILSIMNMGYIQKTYQDITIMPSGDGFYWKISINQAALKFGDVISNYVSEHPPEQLYKFKKFPKNTLPTILKIQSPWFVEIPEGYSLLSMPIPYNDNVTFTAATGILKGNNFCNVQVYVHSLNEEIFIPKGTPLCQYILIKDEPDTCELKVIESRDQFLKLYQDNKFCHQFTGHNEPNHTRF
jgi:hypothetical protein